MPFAISRAQIMCRLTNKMEMGTREMHLYYRPYLSAFYSFLNRSQMCESDRKPTFVKNKRILCPKQQSYHCPSAVFHPDGRDFVGHSRAYFSRAVTVSPGALSARKKMHISSHIFVHGMRYLAL